MEKSEIFSTLDKILYKLNMQPRYFLSVLVICLFAYFNTSAQCVTILNLPDTIVTCRNSQVQLNPTLDIANVDRTIDTTWTPAAGLSDPNIINPVATVTTNSIMYTLTVLGVLPANFVANGDFSLGNTSFSSSYTYVAPTPNALTPEGLYTVTTNPNLVHSGFASFGDHTTGTGNMMVINGASSPINVWCQTINVTPNTNYDFSAWAANCSSAGNPAQLQFEINNVLLGSPLQIPNATGQWVEFFITWNSGANTTANICIYDAQTALSGNDFVIDDIKFQEYCTSKDSVYLKVINMQPSITNTISVSCGSNTVSFNGNYAGDVPTSYAWDFGDLGTSTLQNPTHVYTTQGTYTVRLITTKNGCNDTATTQVNIAFNPALNYTIADAPINCLSTTLTATYVSGDNANNFLWLFDDNTSGAGNPATHTFPQTGIHNVRLVLTSALGCRDTIDYQLTLSVNMNYTISDSAISCVSDKLTANYSSGDAANQFRWIFDDTSGTGSPITHTFTQSGAHDVTLIVSTVPGCADTFTHTVNLSINIDYAITDSVLDCKSAKFTATRVAGDTAAHYRWTFDNNIHDTVNPVIHTFIHSGDNQAMLVITNDAGCMDTFMHYFTINYSLVPDFTYFPLSPEIDKPTNFINLSPPVAVTYAWDFGDGTTSTLRNPSKLWNASGTYKVCLTASDTNECSGIVCKMVDAIRTKKVDVPNAFSPDGDGVNDILYVRGAGIAKVSLKIYNRWGQVVFETDDMEKGWNGTFKSDPQAADVYAYVLQATYVDGTSEQKQGNITMIR